MLAGPAITITVNVDSGSYYSLTIRAHHTADPLLPYCDSTSNLKALREELGERLEDMKNATRGELDLRKFPDLMDAAMSRLHETGYDLLPRLLGTQTTMLGKLRQYCATAAFYWRDSEHPFVIEVRGHPDASLPLECLPLFANQTLPPVRDLHALKVEADAYAGFRAVVHRGRFPKSGQATMCGLGAQNSCRLGCSGR